ncbi:MAG: outer membrane protein transport protein [Gammaproteobacteria bacterium]|jgi:long-chain fatty acid transport protein
MVLSAQVQGAGFALIEQSASGMGNAFAGGAASAEDASTVFFNPAGMMNLKRIEVVLVGHAIMPTMKFTNQGSELAETYNGQLLTGDESQDGGNNAFVPNLYYVHGINQNLKFGLGINVPFGLSVTYDDNWVGRYHAVDSELETVNINPSLAFKATENLSLGFGFNVQTAEVILSNVIDFGALIREPQQHDGFAYIKGDNSDSLSYGWNAGLLYQPSNSTRVGVAYRSEIEHKIKGDADFTVPGTVDITDSGLFIDSKVSADVTFPQTLSLSAYHRYDALAVMADITWTGWSAFQELRIKYDNPAQPDSVTTEDWNDTFRYALGVNYRTAPQWLLRGGMAYDETPVPNSQRRTPRIPDNDRLWLSLGFGYQASKALGVDFGYSHLFINNTDINNEFEASASDLRSTLHGTYESSVDIFSLQLTWTIE